MLTRKLWRDLWHLRGQVTAVALVAAVGVANLVMSRATLHSLEASRDRYYREHAFADVFATLKRAPENVARRLRSIEGVAVVDTRIVSAGRAEIPGFADPITVQALSTPEFGGSRLNHLYIKSGRAPEPGDADTLALSDSFAEAHGLRPGDTIDLILHGRRQVFRITGIGSSPEFVSQMAPQAVFPDALRFAIVWMPRPALAAATDLDGAFNSAVFKLSPGANEDAVIIAVDRVLARYGGIGAIGREDQRSHRYLSEEFRQLRTMARLFPAVFLSVSAFVLYVVLSRLVAGQGEQIGTLKAFGLENGEILRHYSGFALLTGLIGAAIGIALGARLAAMLGDLYREFYRLPFLDFQLPASLVWLALAISVGSALVGAAVPAMRAARLPPAEAMRPDVPWQQRRIASSGQWGFSRLSQAHRLIARNLLQRPVRSALTWLGLALGTAIMMMGRFQNDAVDDMVERQFQRSQRHDVAVAFVEPRSPSALHELSTLPGVMVVEGEQAVPVTVRSRSASYRTAVVGLVPGTKLHRPLDSGGHPILPPPGGLLLTDYLAGMLDLRLGDLVELETLEGRRRLMRFPLTGLVDEPFGVQAYVSDAELERELREGPRVSGAVLSVDQAALPRLFAALQARPAIASVSQRRIGIRNFYESMAETILTFTLISTLFGVVITVGVIYSSARVSLSERARDLASLRILGFTEQEVGYLLLGELALLTVLAVPLGFALGNGLIALLVFNFESDLFRVPHYVSPSTYGIAGVVTLATALACGWFTWGRIRKLDLIAVLKARD